MLYIHVQVNTCIVCINLLVKCELKNVNCEVRLCELSVGCLHRANPSPHEEMRAYRP